MITGLNLHRVILNRKHPSDLRLGVECSSMTPVYFFCAYMRLHSLLIVQANTGVLAMDI